MPARHRRNRRRSVSAAGLVQPSDAGMREDTALSQLHDLSGRVSSLEMMLAEQARHCKPVQVLLSFKL